MDTTAGPRSWLPRSIVPCMKSGRRWSRYMGVIVSQSSSDVVAPSAPVRRQRPSTVPFQAQLARLAALKPGRHRVVTCYLKIEQRDRARNKYAIKLKNRLRAVEENRPRLRLDTATLEQVRRDLGRVMEQ